MIPILLLGHKIIENFSWRESVKCVRQFPTICASKLNHLNHMYAILWCLLELAGGQTHRQQAGPGHKTLVPSSEVVSGNVSKT